MDSRERLAQLLSGYQTFISYEPLRSEVPLAEVPLPAHARGYCIPPRASLDPSAQAWKAREFAGSDEVALFIPGREFDSSGTRHGQGGGWYDRFLAKVPREWVRIGFCFEHQFSETPLPRAAHDQAMDYVVVVGKDGTLTLYSSEGPL